jgi:hypothetical protein
MRRRPKGWAGAGERGPVGIWTPNCHLTTQVKLDSHSKPASPAYHPLDEYYYSVVDGPQLMARSHEQRLAWGTRASSKKILLSQPAWQWRSCASRTWSSRWLLPYCGRGPDAGVLTAAQRVDAWPALARWIFLWVDFFALWLQNKFRDMLGYQRIWKKTDY